MRLALWYAVGYRPWLLSLFVVSEFALECWGLLCWLYLHNFCGDSSSDWVAERRSKHRTIDKKMEWQGKIYGILFTNSWWSGLLNTSRWTGKGMEVTRKLECSCLQLLSLVDHCRYSLVPIVAVGVILNFFLGVFYWIWEKERKKNKDVGDIKEEPS